MSTHLLGVFTNHKTKTFTITARKENCPHLKTMIVRENERGYEYSHLARGMNKGGADACKVLARATLEAAEYTKSSRPERVEVYLARVKQENRFAEVDMKTANVKSVFNIA